MAKALKSKESVWYGYLKAGSRSSPVLRDESLDTRNPNSFYMFNLERGVILEYSREVVEKKLRELKPDESGFIKELDAGYKKARSKFKDRSATIRSVTKRGAAKSAEKTKDSKVDADETEVWTDAQEAKSDVSYG